MAMTAATPMIMPSMVRAVRILLRPSALKAMRRVISMDMARFSEGYCPDEAGWSSAVSI